MESQSDSLGCLNIDISDIYKCECTDDLRNIVKLYFENENDKQLMYAMLNKAYEIAKDMSRVETIALMM